MKYVIKKVLQIYLDAAAFGVCVIGAVFWFKLAMQDG